MKLLVERLHGLDDHVGDVAEEPPIDLVDRVARPMVIIVVLDAEVDERQIVLGEDAVVRTEAASGAS